MIIRALIYVFLAFMLFQTKISLGEIGAGFAMGLFFAEVVLFRIVHGKDVRMNQEGGGEDRVVTMKSYISDYYFQMKHDITDERKFHKDDESERFAMDMIVAIRDEANRRKE